MWIVLDVRREVVDIVVLFEEDMNVVFPFVLQPKHISVNTGKQRILEDQVVILLIFLRIPNSQVNVFFNDVTRRTCGRTLVLYLFATHVVGHPFGFLFSDAALVLCGG